MRLLSILLLCSLPLHGQEAQLQALDWAVNMVKKAEVNATIPKIRSFKPVGTNTNPLARAAHVGSVEIAKALIDAGASPSALSEMEVMDGEGGGRIIVCSAFTIAIGDDDTNMLAALLKKTPPIPKISAAPGSLWPIVSTNEFNGLQNAPSKDNPFSLIHYAVASGAYNSAHYLADKMPLNQKTIETPWFDSGAEWMPQTPALPIDLALRKNDPKMVELLLQKGSPPPSPELIASFIPNKCSNPAIVEMIIKAGAKIDKPNKAGQTALGWTTALLNKGVMVTEYGDEMGAYEPPDAETEANLRILEKLLRQAGAKDLGEKDSYQFWMGSDLEYGMFY